MFEVKIEGSEKASSCWELNPCMQDTWLVYIVSALPLSTYARHIEDCESWWLSGCHSSVAEYWLHKPGVLGSIIL